MGALFALPLAVLAVLQDVGADTSLTVRTIRFYRTDGQQTQVNAFLQVPYRMMTSTKPGRDGLLSFTLAVRVIDSLGTSLYEQSWQHSTTVDSARVEGAAIDKIRFTVSAGAYRLVVTATDSVTGVAHSIAVPVAGYSDRPPGSDLLISTRIRSVEPGDSVPKVAELRRGALIVAAGGTVSLTRGASRLYYLLEVYSEKETTSLIQATVQDSAGTMAMRTAPTPVRLTGDVAILTGQLDVRSLNPGRYRLTTTVTIGTKAFDRSAAFEVEGQTASAGRELLPATSSAEHLDDSTWAAGLDENGVNAAIAPLALIARPSDPNLRLVAPDPVTRRRFLVAFWSRRDPTPKTPVNEAREDFYQSVGSANEAYTEGGNRGVPGWKTDRGRIFVKLGSPDVVQRRPARGAAPAYEVWRYRQAPGYFYVFVERPSLGTFALVHTNDPKESRDRSWRQILTEPSAVEIINFLR